MADNKINPYLQSNEEYMSQVNTESGPAPASASADVNVNLDRDYDVLDTEGNLRKVAGKDLQEVLDAGVARLVSAEEKFAIESEKKYGDDNIEAAALGAARGLSFGLSDQALKASGAYTGEELKGLEAANPVASIGGEIVGTVAPAVLSGGTSLVGSGAKAATVGVRAAEKLGEKAALAASKALIKDGVNKSAAKAIAQKMLPEIVNLGVQGAAQGVGRLVTEDAFGDADFNAQNLIAYAGMGSIIGGGFGSIVGGVKYVTPALKNITGRIGESIESGMGKMFDPGDAAVEAVGLSPSQVVKAVDNNPNFKQDLVDQLTDTMARNKDHSYEGLYKAIDADREAAGKAIGEIYKQADSIMTDAGRKLDNVELSSRVIATADEYIDKLGMTYKAEPDLIERLRKYSSSYAELVAKESEMGAVKLQEEAVQLQDRIFKGKSFGANLQEGTLADMQDVIRREVRTAQKEYVKAAQDLSGVDLLSKLEKANKTFSIYSSIDKTVDKAAEKATRGNILDSLKDTGAWATGLLTGEPTSALAYLGFKKAIGSYTAQKSIIMGKLQMSQMKSLQVIKSAAKNIGSATSQLVDAADDAAYRHITSFALAKKDGKKPQNEQEAYRNIVDNLSQTEVDPEGVLKHANKSTAQMFTHAPQTAARIDALYLQGLSYMNSKAKKSKKQKGAFDFNVKTGVPTLEISKMARRLEAFEDPYSVIKKASRGKVSREGVEVLKNVYPKLHEKLQLETLDYINKNKKSMSYQEKLKLSVLLDVKGHETLDKNKVASLQQIITNDTATEEQGPKYSAARVENISKADKFTTTTQEKGEI